MLKRIIITKSMFYARMMRAQGFYVYGPYHNDKIYIHKHKVKTGFFSTK